MASGIQVLNSELHVAKVVKLEIDGVNVLANPLINPSGDVDIMTTGNGSDVTITANNDVNITGRTITLNAGNEIVLNADNGVRWPFASVTQLTSLITPVTINTSAGAITTVNANIAPIPAGGEFSFAVNNAVCKEGSIINFNSNRSGLIVWPSNVVDGRFVVNCLAVNQITVDTIQILFWIV